MIYCVSDFHGNLEAYKALKKALHPEDICIVIGDACDRGQHGVEILLDIKEDDRFMYIIGNHDDFVLRTYLPEKVKSTKHDSAWGKACWLYNHGPSIDEWETLKSRNLRQFKELLAWLAKCKVFAQVYCNDTLYRIAHAKYPKNVDVSSMTWEEMEEYNSDLLFSTIWDRYRDYRDLDEFVSDGCITLIGHTPLHGKNPNVAEGLVNLDCGLGYGHDRVAAYSLSEGRVYWIDSKTLLPRGRDQLRILKDLNLEFFKDSKGKKIYSIPEAKRMSRFEEIRAFGIHTDLDRGFLDDEIITSPIRNIKQINDLTLICTRNTVYRRA